MPSHGVKTSDASRVLGYLLYMSEAELPRKRVILMSDGTGETAAIMIKAAMVQFGEQKVIFTRYKNVRTEAQVEAICEDANTHKDLIIHTLASPELRLFLAECAKRYNFKTVDLLGPILVGLGNYLGYEPRSIAGLLHDVNEDYFKRVEAIEYTVQHDDGKDLTGLDRADLVILGISRTSKTPLSIYLAHQGWRVANIPLIKDFVLPAEIFNIEQKRIIGLTIDAEDLTTIRRARLERLGQERGGEYADPDKVLEEIEYVNDLFRKNRRWPVFNVTGKALEETASEIIKLMVSRRLSPTQF